MSTMKDICMPNPCECPEAPDAMRPNEAGQTAVSYRLGTHEEFLHRMLDRLHTNQLFRERLTTRNADDPAIALMDAWAVIGDVLSFYQERIANEGFLRTAIERRSILEMARTIGYELNPGLAAGTYLAFTVDDTTQAYSKVVVPAGTRVQSLPAQDKLPQTFETIADIEARAEWNALKVQQTEQQVIAQGMKELCLKGTKTQLQPGDAILIIGDERDSESPTSENWDVRFLTAVKSYPEKDYTLVIWDEGLGFKHNDHTVKPAEKNVKVFAFRQRAALFGQNAPDWKVLPESVKIEYLKSAEHPLQWRSGSTPEDSTNWMVYTPDSIYVDVDTSSAAFTSTPIYFTSLAGASNHWDAIGVTAVYNATKNGFRIYLRSSWVALTPDYAKSHKWHIQWLGIEAGQNGPVADWPAEIFKIRTAGDKLIDLDAAYPKLVAGSWLALTKPGEHRQYVELYKVGKATPTSRTDFTVTAKTTRLKLDTNIHLELFGLRETAVLCQSEELELAEKVIAQPVHGDRIVLETLVAALKVGQALAITGKPARVTIARNANGLNLETNNGASTVPLDPGDSLQLVEAPSIQGAGGSDAVILDPEALTRALEKADPTIITWKLKDRNGAIGCLEAASDQLDLGYAEKDDEPGSEIAFIVHLHNNRDHTIITLLKPLKGSYDRTTVSINGNVVESSHGETVRNEILGSGDGARTNQTFVLKKPSLTYISGETANGRQSTLSVRVNGVQWQEAGSLYGIEAHSKNYVVQIDNDAKTSVIFGDGKNGARLPSGMENIVATYRYGIGPDGNTDAGRLTLLQTRPTGIRGVSNPISASGGTAAERLEAARHNAPLKVLTMDRIVSLQDYEDYARAFTGVGKAQAVLLWNGDSDLVHITVAGSGGEVLDSTSTVLLKLAKSIAKYRNPLSTVQIDSYDRSFFALKARIHVGSTYIADTVLSEAKAALEAAFSFDQRTFGQGVTSAQVISTIQQVPGVTYVDLDKLYFSDPEYLHDAKLGPGQSGPAALLTANRAQWIDKKGFKKASLLLIDPAGITLEEIKA